MVPTNSFAGHQLDKAGARGPRGHIGADVSGGHGIDKLEAMVRRVVAEELRPLSEALLALADTVG